MDAATRPLGLVLVACAVPLLIGGCKSSEAPSVATTINITPTTATLAAIGRTKQFTAVVLDQHGQALPTAVVTWSSSDTTVVKVVAATGYATAIANGGALVKATSGAAVQTAPVTVAQVAATLAKVSGDAQSATVGKALAQALVVQVSDSGATPVVGATVTFAVTAGGGAVGTPSAVTGANGQAQTTWTMGQAAGAQSASATVAGGAPPLGFSATATPGAAKSVAKQAGDGQTRGSGTTVLTAPAVIVRDTFNNPVPGAAVTYSVPAGSGSITGANQTTNVTGSGITGNPATFTATSQAIGAPANVTVFVGNNQPGLVGYGVNVRPAVLVTDAGSNPVPNATVTFAVQTGGGSVTGGTATTNARGVAQVGKWTLGASAGVNTLSATVTGSGITGNPVAFADTGVAAGYNITIQYFGPTPSAAVQAAMDSAVAKWERLIYRSVGAISLNYAAGTCGTGTPAINTVVNSLLILASFDSIDGPGKVLGQAGPCLIRNSNGLTAVGVMEFDTADVAGLINSGQMNEVMLHEMGHVIGFGTLWDNPPFSWLQQPSNPPTTILDTYFNGPLALAEFDSLGGTSYTGASLSPPGGNKVPVENCGASSPSGCGAGTVNGHWSEPVFGNELMSGYINSGTNPLSAISVAAQGDLGYAVNYDAADPYVHTFTLRAGGGPPPLYLGNDIRRGPIYVVNSFGRVVGVR